ncbi:RNA ligase family protein [Roseobacteraceae bacterium S113]
MSDLSGLLGQEGIVTEKMDGENTTIHSRGLYARSPDSRYHPSRDWVKSFAAGISHLLAPNERIVGENVFARHSVAYYALASYFYGFAWIVEDQVMSWADTKTRFAELGITSVPLLYSGRMTQSALDGVIAQMDFDAQEGFVARIAASFAENTMARHVGKYVRQGHVQSETHWMKGPFIANKLA